MTVPGYYGCDCDKYNPNCRCYPREDTTTYIATVYGDGAALSTDACTMREAFDWLKHHVGGFRDEWTHGDVRLDGAKLVYFDPRETIWYGDGFARWEERR